MPFFIHPRGARVSSQLPLAGRGGAYIATPELIGGARDARRRSKALKSVRLLKTQSLKIFLAKSNVGSRSGERSKAALFALSAAETRPATAASANSAKMLLKGWRRCLVNKRLILSTGQGQVKWGHHMKYCTSVVWHVFNGLFGT